MSNRHLRGLVLSALILCSFTGEGQITMPDNVCMGQTRQYHVESNPGSTYCWRVNGKIQPGITTSLFTYTWLSAGTFILDVRERSAEGCLGPLRSGLIYVNPILCNYLVLHDSFSPNGDLVNDFWIIGNADQYPGMVVTIYNRWGQSLWKSESGYPVPWDGTSNGRDLPVDSYHYIITLQNGLAPVIGDVTIVR